MAGAGYKLFATGDVLTAAQVNTYLNEQTVMVFADSAARTTALSGVLAEGMMSYLQDTNAVEVYNGSSWVAVGGGGLTSPLTTKGDIWVYGTGDTRLPVGTDGHTLVADSVETTGLKWAAPASGGGMTLINSGGTALSGATTTISSIPTTYNDLIIYIVDYYGSTDTNIHLRINSDATAANYQQFVNRGTGSSDGSYVTNGDAGMDLNGYSIDNVSNDNFTTVYIPDYANTVSKKVANSMSGFVQTTGAKAVSNNTTYYAGSTLAITELAFRSSDGSGWSGGTVYVYGVK